MASGPEGTEPLKNMQIWVLKVSIHCEGCKKKVRKVLQGVEGVYTIDIDSKQNKVTVAGNVDADSLIRRLLKHGKHSELWPEKKPVSTNSLGGATADSKAKGKEKAASAAAAVPKSEQQPANAENKQQAEESKPAAAQETAAAPPETASEAVKSAASREATATEPNSDGPKDSDGDEPLKSDKKQGEKPPSGAEAPSDGSEKKNGKKVHTESSSGDEEVTSDTDGATSWHAATVESPQLPYQLPAYSHPVYTMSYNNVHPSTSYAYYTAPPPEMPSSYYGYSGYPPPSAYPPPSVNPPQSDQPQYYPSDSYYGAMEPPPSAGSYDMFNDENPNSCNLM